MATEVQVVKSNALVEASYRLSVAEQRIILACISQVRRDEQITDDKLYSVRVSDIAELSGSDSKAMYADLAAAALRLKRREVRLTQEPNGAGKKSKVMVTGWVQTIFYVESEGRVELRFSKDMLPYLSALTAQFTQYALSDVAKMTSSYGIRLFELLAQWGGVGEREIEISQLREWLQLEDRYPLIADLRRWVLDPALEQINKHSPMCASWKPKKTGRKITHAVFTFSKQRSRAPSKKKPALTNAYIAKHARPGESYEQAYRRLAEEKG